MPFEELSHTGDLQYRVWGSSSTLVLQDAALALFSTITDLSAVRPLESRYVEVEGEGDELLIDYLRACLGLFDESEFVASECAVTEAPNGLRARLRGETLDGARHPFDTEIKAVTYHAASFERRPGGFEAVFTLDL